MGSVTSLSVSIRKRWPSRDSLILAGNSKQRSGGTDLDGLALRIETDRHRDEPVIGPEVEELLTVPPPAHLNAAAG